MKAEIDNFAWDLSKENIIPLKTGRSVEQLSKVLQVQHNVSFNLWRDKIRWHFDEALKTCPLPHKLDLYTRYVRWIDENYPSLGASAHLSDILYRCVDDTNQIEGVHNNPDYINIWLRLIKFCDSPIELFRLLFQNGVGTLCAAFYVAWAEQIQSLPSSDCGKQTARIATILVHGLRANAQPISLLEDKSEALIQSINRSAQLEIEERDFNNLSSNSTISSKTRETERKTLATILPSDKISSMRIGSVIDSKQTGLRGLKTKPITSDNCDLQVFRDTNISAGHSLLLKSCTPGTVLHKIACVERLAKPVANWNLENLKQHDGQLHRQSAEAFVPELNEGSSPHDNIHQTTLDVYRDIIPRESTSSKSTHAASQSQPRKSRGLQLSAHTSSSSSSSSTTTLPFLFPLQTLKQLFYKSSLLAEDVGQSPSEFYCDIKLLYGISEETCFEMNMATDKKISSNLISGEEFSPQLIDKFSQSILKDIADIVNGKWSSKSDSRIIPNSATKQSGREQKLNTENLINKLSQFSCK